MSTQQMPNDSDTVQVCPTCDGSGLDWGETCLQCGGVGKVDSDGLTTLTDEAARNDA